MEYNSESNPNLGKSTGIEGVYLSSLKTNKYNSEKKSSYVVFQPNGDSYNALVDYDIGYDISKSLPNNNLKYSDNEDSKQDVHSNSKPDRFAMGSHPINHFFIGSVTVIGLLVLYRFLNKNK